MHTRPPYSPAGAARSGAGTPGPCRGATPTDLPRRWLAHETAFAVGGYGGAGSSGHGTIVHIRGDLPVLLCAPHAVNHPREGATKPADRRTGGLALLVAEQTGASALAALSPVPDRDWDGRDDPFAGALRSAVAAGTVVLDLHGMRDSHDWDVCLGTHHRTDPATTAVRDALIRAAQGLRTSVDDPFAALGARTVLAHVTALGGTGLQVELAARLRDPGAAPGAAGRAVRALTEAVLECAGCPTITGI